MMKLQNGIEQQRNREIRKAVEFVVENAVEVESAK